MFHITKDMILIYYLLSYSFYCMEIDQPVLCIMCIFMVKTFRLEGKRMFGSLCFGYTS